MSEKFSSSIKAIVPVVREHLLPLIEEAADTCVRAYAADEFNDTYTFGTQLWRNVWNRFLPVASDESIPLSHSGVKTDFSLRCGSISLEHHRVRKDTRLPINALAVKKKIDRGQLSLFADQPDDTGFAESVVLAIVAEPEEGLMEIFLGVLQKDGFTGMP